MVEYNTVNVVKNNEGKTLRMNARMFNLDN